jgi:hypothetical protein
MSNLVRLHRHRERQRAGKKCYTIAVDEIAVECLLQNAGLLAPGDPSHADIVAAIERFIELGAKYFLSRDDSILDGRISVR